MALVLYLFDVAYSMAHYKNHDGSTIAWILGLIIIFLTVFVFSILVNRNVWGWILFAISWLSLTILKYITTFEGNTFGI